MKTEAEVRQTLDRLQREQANTNQVLAGLGTTSGVLEFTNKDTPENRAILDQKSRALQAQIEILDWLLSR